MEIVVEGTGVKEVLPDLVKIRIEFKFLEKTYDKSLEAGTNSVTEFINNVLPQLDLKKEDFKTTRFSIEHIIETDYKTNKEKDLGYQFKQISNIEGNNDIDCPSFLRKKEEKAFTGFTDSFTPEKIKITQTIYTLWIAE